MKALELDALMQGESRYLLLDGAQCTALPRHVLSPAWTEQMAPLFDGVLSDGQKDVAPYLVQLRNADDAERAYRALSPQLTHAGAVAWLDSPLTHGELVVRLSHRLYTALPNGKRLLLRMYDGRVLPHLADVLDPEQRALYFAVSRRWWYLSSQSQWNWIEGRPSMNDPLHELLTLSGEQRRCLQDACYPYSLIEHFMDTAPELLDTVAPAERYAFFRNTIVAAERIGLSAAGDFVLFCTLALLEGLEFYASDVWRERMGQVANGQRSLHAIFGEHYREAELDEE